MKATTTLIAAIAIAIIAAAGRAGETTASILGGARCDGERANIADLADAIDEATDDRTVKALVIAVGRYESGGWRADVCSGAKTGDNGRAFGCWQSWHPDRSDGYRGQAKRAARHLRWAMAKCGTREGAISLYATGNRCAWSGAKERADYAENVESRLVW